MRLDALGGLWRSPTAGDLEVESGLQIQPELRVVAE
jgi:hypothetical protein